MVHNTSLSRRTLMQTTASLAAGAAVVACTPRAVNNPASESRSDDVEYRFYRNATAKLSYAGLTFLLDPMLSAKGELPSFAGIAPNPTVELPVSGEDIISNIDAVIVSHMHEDHFDDAAASIIDKQLPLLTPRNSAPISPRDPTRTISHRQRLIDYGFEDVREIDADGSGATVFEGVTLTQVWALHGQGRVGELMGGVNGIIFTAQDMPTIYWAGDTILDVAEVEPILERYAPDIIIAHTGGPIVEVLSPEILLMDAAQGANLVELANRHNPKVQIVAVHMEALDHCFSSRADLRSRVATLSAEVARRVFVPADGEKLKLL